jgi:hypothetical protein
VEGKSKEILGTTYAKLKEMCATISTCGYFDRLVEVTGEEQAEVVRFFPNLGQQDINRLSLFSDSPGYSISVSIVIN